MCGSNQPMKQAALEGSRGSIFTGGGPGGFPGAMLGMFVQARKQAGQLKNPTGHTFVDYLTRDNPQIRDQINAATPPKVVGNGLSIKQSSGNITGSGTRVAARKRATARQSRTKRFTTR